jgi:hypothetical protein
MEETAFRFISEFGMTAFMLICFVLGTAYTARWVSINILVPLSGSAIDYLEKQTMATTENINSLRQMADMEKDIKECMEETKNLHLDENSIFSTVHTNTSIEILSAAIKRVADKMDVDINDLTIELSRVLKRQK